MRLIARLAVIFGVAAIPATTFAQRGHHAASRPPQVHHSAPAAHHNAPKPQSHPPKPQAHPSKPQGHPTGAKTASHPSQSRPQAKAKVHVAQAPSTTIA